MFFTTLIKFICKILQLILKPTKCCDILLKKRTFFTMGIMDYLNGKKTQRIFAKYFNNGGKGLTKDEIKMVNDAILKSGMVVSGEIEHNSITNLAAYAHLSADLKSRLILEPRKETREKLENGEVVNKNLAFLATNKLVFTQDMTLNTINADTTVNGTPYKVYEITVSDDPKDLEVKSVKFEQMNHKEQLNTINTIKNFAKVKPATPTSHSLREL